MSDGTSRAAQGRHRAASGRGRKLLLGRPQITGRGGLPSATARGPMASFGSQGNPGGLGDLGGLVGGAPPSLLEPDSNRQRRLLEELLLLLRGRGVAEPFSPQDPGGPSDPGGVTGTGFTGSPQVVSVGGRGGLGQPPAGPGTIPGFGATGPQLGDPGQPDFPGGLDLSGQPSEDPVELLADPVAARRRRAMLAMMQRLIAPSAGLFNKFRPKIKDGSSTFMGAFPPKDGEPA